MWLLAVIVFCDRCLVLQQRPHSSIKQFGQKTIIFVVFAIIDIIVAIIDIIVAILSIKVEDIVSLMKMKSGQG